MMFYLNSLGTRSFNGFITRLAKGIVHLVIMESAIGGIAKHIEGLVGEGALTCLASKTGRMPFTLQFAVLRTDSFLLDRLVTPTAFGQEQVCKIGRAVDTPILLDMPGRTVGGLDYGFAAVVALQVVIVPCLAQSIDGRLVRVDRTITPCTHREPTPLDPQLLLLLLLLSHPGEILVTVNAALEFVCMTSRVEELLAVCTFEAFGVEVSYTDHLDRSVKF